MLFVHALCMPCQDNKSYGQVVHLDISYRDRGGAAGHLRGISALPEGFCRVKEHDNLAVSNPLSWG